MSQRKHLWGLEEKRRARTEILIQISFCVQICRRFRGCEKIFAFRKRSWRDMNLGTLQVHGGRATARRPLRDEARHGSRELIRACVSLFVCAGRDSEYTYTIRHSRVVEAPVSRGSSASSGRRGMMSKYPDAWRTTARRRRSTSSARCSRRGRACASRGPSVPRQYKMCLSFLVSRSFPVRSGRSMVSWNVTARPREYVCELSRSSLARHRLNPSLKIQRNPKSTPSVGDRRARRSRTATTVPPSCWAAPASSRHLAPRP